MYSNIKCHDIEIYGQFEGDLEPITLNSGDYLFIPAHTKHRVHWTHPEIKSIWLAIHLYPTESDHE